MVNLQLTHSNKSQIKVWYNLEESLNNFIDDTLNEIIDNSNSKLFLNLLSQKQKFIDETEYIEYNCIYLNQYKGLYYKYNECENTWSISVDDLGKSTVLTFNADIYRIDQCLKIANEKINRKLT